jgi:hypothetical protein
VDAGVCFHYGQMGRVVAVGDISGRGRRGYVGGEAGERASCIVGISMVGGVERIPRAHCLLANIKLWSSRYRVGPSGLMTQCLGQPFLIDEAWAGFDWCDFWSLLLLFALCLLHSYS